MTAQARRTWVVIIAITAAVLLYALSLAQRDVERLEVRVTELEATVTVQAEAMDSIAGSVERAHAACIESELCVEVLP